MARATHAAVWLVKTGSNVWDEEGRLGGSTDLPLSERGLQEAQERARALSGQVLSQVLCGPDEASMESARLIAEATGSKFKAINGLREIAFGLWEGVLLSQIEDRCPTTFRKWKEDPGVVNIPGGETLADAQGRMLDAFRKLVPKHAGKSGTLAVVLRPAALALARRWIQNRPTSELWALATEGSGVERQNIDCSRLRERLGLIKASAAR